jgi:hypothetical protein
VSWIASSLPRKPASSPHNKAAVFAVSNGSEKRLRRCDAGVFQFSRRSQGERLGQFTVHKCVRPGFWRTGFRFDAFS